MTQPARSAPADPEQVKRWRELLASERDAAVSYSRLADAETGERSKIMRVAAAVTFGAGHLIGGAVS